MWNPNKRKHNFKDLTGKEQGCFTVVEFKGHTTNGGAKWLVHCKVTGKDSIRSAGSILKGSTCCVYCAKKASGQKRRKHGHAVNGTTRTYQCWLSMHARCENTNHHDYHNYGGRGITVCPEWKEYAAFLRDMGERPANGLSLERKDNSKGYSKENCIWATVEQQANNKRTNVFLEYDGKRLTISQWSRERKIPKSTLYNRIQAGCSVADILAV